MPLFQGNAIPSATGFDIDNSLRFNAPDSSYTSFTPSSNGNRRTWTWSGWIKRGCTGSTRGGKLAYQGVFMAGATNYESHIKLFINDKIDLEEYNNGSRPWHLKTTAVYSDVSNWYHICVAFDTTQGTASNRIKVYVNGTRVTAFDTETYPSQNHDTQWNSTSHPMMHGRDGSNSQKFDGYMAEIHYIDGTALTPSSFGEVDEDYGHWKPKKVEGLTYGTNGFYLDFKNASSLGNDANGSNNSSVTNFAASDQTLDTPTNNFAVINSREDVYPPSDDSATTIQQGNLQVTNTANSAACLRRATFGMDSGKWYWEVLRNNTSGSETGTTLGIMPAAAGLGTTSNYIGASGANEKGGLGFYGSGSTSGLNNGGSSWGVMDAQAANSVIMFAYDCATGKMWVGYNGTWKNYGGSTAAGNPAAGTYPWGQFTDTVVTKSPAFQFHNNVEYIANFGQEGTFAGRKTAGGNSDDNGYGNFLYDVPAGFLALCSKNIPEPAVKPRENFHTKLYTGNGSAGHAITGVGFQPDMIWIKNRSAAGEAHPVFDSVRGHSSGNYWKLRGDTTDDEDADVDGMTAIGTDGFTVGNNGQVNGNSNNMAAWCWKTGTSAASNTNGSITSSVSANVAAGFSIVTYTGTGSNATVGHGLSQAPDMVIVKRRNANGQNWIMGTDSQEAKKLHSGTFNMNGSMPLNDTTVWTDETVWNDTSPTSTVFSLGGSDGRNNASGGTYVAYCFHNVEGYSKIGAYDSGAGGAENGVGGDISGTAIYTGFKPAFILIKPFDQGGNGWRVIDGERDSYINPINSHISWHSASAITGSIVEGNTANGEGVKLDFYSNGFKNMERDSWFNDYRYCYFYYAVASFPFKYSNAG